MKSNYTFSVIITYKHNFQRWENLKKVINWWKCFSGVEIIVVEQDKHSKIAHLVSGYKHIFQKSNRPFNKSLAYNLGLKNASTEAIVFTDSDLVMDPNKFIEALNSLKEYDMVNPYTSVVDLTPDESYMDMANIIKINRPGRGETDHQKVPLCGGMNIFRKEAIFAIGGWSESFIGWGGEDDFQEIKVKHFLKWFSLEGKSFHLYHDREAPDQELYMRNLQLLAKMKELSKDDIAKIINSTNGKIGIKSLYDTF